MPAPSNLLKFRPVLTLAQIQHISLLCHAHAAHGDTEEREMRQSILRVIVPLIAKVEVGAINPAYKLSETAQIKRDESAQRARYESGQMTPEEEAEYEAKILGV